VRLVVEGGATSTDDAQAAKAAVVERRRRRFDAHVEAVDAATPVAAATHGGAHDLVCHGGYHIVQTVPVGQVGGGGVVFAGDAVVLLLLGGHLADDALDGGDFAQDAAVGAAVLGVPLPQQLQL